RNARVANFAVDRNAKSGGAQRRTVVASGGLNEHVVERSTPQKTPICRAIQSHTARQRQSSQAGSSAERSTNMQHHAVETLLQGGGCVAMIVRDLVFGQTRFDQV